MRVLRSTVSLLLLMSAVARAEPPASKPFDLPGAIADGTPLSADEAATRALRSSPSIERAAALTRVAEVVVLRTRDQLLPRLDLLARYAHVDGFPDGRIELGADPEALAAARMLAMQVSDPAARTLLLAQTERPTARTIEIPRDQVALSARLSWPVSDLFFSVAPAIAAAEAQVRVSRAQERARAARVALSAREAYYQLVRARGARAVAERAIEQANAQKDRIDSSVRAGLRAPADAASAYARVAAAEQALAAAGAAVDVADAALRTLLGDEDGVAYGLVEPLGTPLAVEQAPVAELIARARTRRPELVAVRETIVAQRKLARVQTAAGYPHLGVFVGGDYAMPNRYVIPPSKELQPSWEVGAQLSYAPNDTLLGRRRAREIGGQIEVLEADLAELERALILEVRQARALSTRAARTLEAASTSQAAAEDAYRQREAELSAGAAVTADLFAAEAELNRARLELLDAAVEQRLARARLAYAVGEP